MPIGKIIAAIVLVLAIVFIVLARIDLVVGLLIAALAVALLI